MAAAKFRFRKNDRIGAAAAEDDEDFLTDCFVDNGDLDLLQDVSDNRQILIGRTGAGKSAFLCHLARERPDKVVVLSPDDLAITWVANSNILAFFSAIGVNLDPFFKLLWRHVLTVEVLKKHMSMNGALPKDSFIDNLAAMFTGRTTQAQQAREALNYLRTWGESFWKESEYRVKEVTAKLEENLKGKMSGSPIESVLNTNLSLEAAQTLSEEQRIEVVNRAQRVISAAQVKDLTKVIQLLDSVLSDRQKHYYIVIDRLDENWVEDKIRYKLIMALIVTARDFCRVKNAKVIIAMRRDLIDRVFKLSRVSGFQEEKHQSLYLTLTWSRSKLLELLDRRIDRLVRRRYSKQRVTHKDLLPKTVGKVKIDDYLISRAPRPRDIIAFFNACIAAAPDAAKLNVNLLRTAEGEYSRSRLRALGDEWSSDYPSLVDFARILQKRAASFKLGTITEEEAGDLCLKVVVENSEMTGLLELQAKQVAEGNVPPLDFRNALFRVFYRVGLVGLKLESYETVSWADETGRSVSSAEVSDTVSIVVHSAYHRALGIVKPEKDR